MIRSQTWTGRPPWAGSLIDAARNAYWAIYDALHPRHGMSELIIFPSLEAARRAGFAGGRHDAMPHARSWWPGAGEKGLYCRPFQRVTISADARLSDLHYRLIAARMMTYRNPIWVTL